MKLLVGIATVTDRLAKFERLMMTLNPQLSEDVGVLVLSDNRELTLGYKRQQIIKRCTAPYVVMVDDDDEVSHDYAQTVLRALESQPDAVGMTATRIQNGMEYPMYYSVKNFWANHEASYDRPISHICPVRTELALKAGYNDIGYGEDRDYMHRLCPLLRTEAYIPTPIYRYHYDPYLSLCTYQSDKQKFMQRYGGDFEATMDVRVWTNSHVEVDDINIPLNPTKFQQNVVIKRQDNTISIQLDDDNIILKTTTKPNVKVSVFGAYIGSVEAYCNGVKVNR